MRPLLASFLLLSFASAQELHRERFNEGTCRFEGRIQDIIPVDLDNDGRRDLLVTHAAFPHEGGKMPLRYVSLKWHRPGAPLDGKPDQTWIIPDEAAVLIFGNYTEAPGTEIGYLCASGAFVWELKGQKYDLLAKRLIMNETFFDLPQDDSFPLWWWPLDIDMNGLTDLLLPQHDSYRLYVQTKPGVYGRAISLSMRNTSKAEEGGSAFLRVVKSLARVETQDVNGDFRQDVCLIWKDQFIFFLQGTEKVNGQDAISFPKEPSGQFQLRFLQQKEKKDQIATAITYLRDLNRGGGVDFIASYTRGELANIGAISTDYYMYLGNGGQALANLSPNWRISLPGISYNPQIEDLNGDGFDDIVVSSVETGMLSNVGKVAFQSVPITYYAYLFDRGSQAFSAEYDFKEVIYVDVDKMNAGGGMPQLKFGSDFDGDGRRDIMRLDSDGWLSSARGITVKTLLKDNPVDYEKTDIFKLNVNDKDEDGKVDAPKGLDIYDLNGDGKADVMLRWGDRVRILVTR